MKDLINKKHFAFNVWNFESARAVIDAASLANQDVILQTSTGIYKDIPAKQFSNFVHSYSESCNINAWLNLDHCKDKDMLFSAIDNGWDMIMADGSSMSIEDNIIFTKEIIEYAHKRGTLVEAEVGQVKGIEEDVVVQQDAIASKEDVQRFLKEVDVDFIAVAFGNAHGEYKVTPNLHYDLVEYTNSLTNKPFVVHGGSGLSDEVLLKLLSIDGVKKINISTDLKLAYKRGVEKSLDLLAQPIKTANIIHDEIKDEVLSKLKLTGECK